MEWFLILLGGLLGAGHCLGMCGGFVLTLGTRSGGLLANLTRQSLYALGRVFTYAVGGAVVGYCGWRLESQLRTVVNLQAWLAMLAGLLLIVQGLLAAGIRFRTRTPAAHGCLGPALFGGLLGATRGRSVFLAGVVNGLLPCGLVYAYLSLAASAGNMFRGAAVMALFGLGTMPALILLGCGGTFLGLAFRRRLLTAAAWCVVLTGLLALVRGWHFLQTGDPASCPHCG